MIACYLLRKTEPPKRQFFNKKKTSMEVEIIAKHERHRHTHSDRHIKRNLQVSNPDGEKNIVSDMSRKQERRETSRQKREDRGDMRRRKGMRQTKETWKRQKRGYFSVSPSAKQHFTSESPTLPFCRPEAEFVHSRDRKADLENPMCNLFGWDGVTLQHPCSEKYALQYHGRTCSKQFHI